MERFFLDHPLYIMVDEATGIIVQESRTMDPHPSKTMVKGLDPSRTMVKGLHVSRTMGLGLNSNRTMGLHLSRTMGLRVSRIMHHHHSRAMHHGQIKATGNHHHHHRALGRIPSKVMGIHQITHLNKILVQQDQGKEIQCLLIRETSINRSPGTNIHRGALCKMVITGAGWTREFFICSK